MVIRVDIDGTICTQVDDGNYYNAQPIQDNINKINEMYYKGHQIIYWTSRGTITGKDWKEVTKSQLESWCCMYDVLEMKKPYYDLMICDKTKRIEEI